MSQGTQIEYRGWIIEPQTYQSNGGRWRAKALAWVRTGDGKVSEKKFGLPPDKMFDTEEEARDFIVAEAQRWIDDHI